MTSTHLKNNDFQSTNWVEMRVRARHERNFAINTALRALFANRRSPKSTLEI